MFLKRIHPLSPHLFNQIAAGEVIERPASVVKEVLENALDAGATKIIVEIEKSGRQLIRIRDNGSGIHPDDLLLAVSPHATSKILEAKDLEQIASLGFRGEALASIAAVSDFRLISALENHEAKELSVMVGQINSELRSAAHPIGTTVEMRELFKNTPVRRRFLRSDKTEWNHILENVRKIALSRDNVALTLIHNSETILQISAMPSDLDGQLKRISKIVGKNLMGKMLPVFEEAEGLSLQGWINTVKMSSAHNDLQYFFLNGRCIRDKVIQHALRVVAQAILPLGRHAGYVLYLECDPALVDVNVHPTKHEVRFQEPRLFHDFIVRALERAWDLSESGFSGLKDLQDGFFVVASEAKQSSFTKVPKLDCIEEERVPYHIQRVTRRCEERSDEAIQHCSTFENSGLLRFARNDGLMNCAAIPVATNPLGTPLAITHQRYLITELPEGLLIIDLLLFKIQKIKKILQQATLEQPIKSKPLLWPKLIQLDKAIINSLLESKINWKAYGIIWEVSGLEEITLRRIPVFLEQVDLQELFVFLSQSLNNSIELIAEAGVKQFLQKMCLEGMDAVLQEMNVLEEVELDLLCRKYILSN